MLALFETIFFRNFGADNLTIRKHCGITITPSPDKTFQVAGWIPDARILLPDPRRFLMTEFAIFDNFELAYSKLAIPKPNRSTLLET